MTYSVKHFCKLQVNKYAVFANAKYAMKKQTDINIQPKATVGDSVGGYKLELATRLEAVADSVGGKRELANLSGVDEGQLYRYLRGENVPSMHAVVRIADAARVNLEWLATGRGEMHPRVEDQAKLGSDFALVPIYNVSISAGAGAFPNKEHAIGNLAFTRHWLRTRGLQPSHLVATNAKGDSMEPSINDGDMLLIDTNQRGLGQDDIYVIRRDDALMVKRLQLGFDNNALIISDNPRYKEQSIPTQDLDIIGRVVWIGHTL